MYTGVCLNAASEVLHAISHSDVYVLFACAQQLSDGSQFPSQSEKSVFLHIACCFRTVCLNWASTMCQQKVFRRPRRTGEKKWDSTAVIAGMFGQLP